MNWIERLKKIEKVKFWIHVTTLGLMRLAIIAACAKYIFS
jgi:hypothetical protein